MLTLEDLKESSGYQLLFKMAQQDARQEEARQLVRRVITLRFSELGAIPELDSIRDTTRLEALFDEVVVAKDAGQVLAAIRR